MLQFLRAQSVGRHQLEAKAPARIRECIHQSQDVLHLQGCGDGLWGPGAPHIGRKILRWIPFLALLRCSSRAQRSRAVVHCIWIWRARPPGLSAQIFASPSSNCLAFCGGAGIAMAPSTCFM